MAYVRPPARFRTVRWAVVSPNRDVIGAFAETKPEAIEAFMDAARQRASNDAETKWTTWARRGCEVIHVEIVEAPKKGSKRWNQLLRLERGFA